jgi:hypothetical protein
MKRNKSISRAALLLIAMTGLVVSQPPPTPYYWGTALTGNGNKRAKVVVPRETQYRDGAAYVAQRGHYPMWDAHYSADWYVASGRDDMNRGRDHWVDGVHEIPERAIRRNWIEAIQDHECFPEDEMVSTALYNAGNRAGWRRALRPNVCIQCGIGGCEKRRLSGLATGNGNQGTGAGTHGAADNTTIGLPEGQTV